MPAAASNRRTPDSVWLQQEGIYYSTYMTSRRAAAGVEPHPSCVSALPPSEGQPHSHDMAAAPSLGSAGHNFRGEKTTPVTSEACMSLLSKKKSFPEAPPTANAPDVSLAGTKSHAHASTNHRQGAAPSAPPPSREAHGTQRG